MRLKIILIITTLLGYSSLLNASILYKCEAINEKKVVINFRVEIDNLKKVVNHHFGNGRSFQGEPIYSDGIVSYQQITSKMGDFNLLQVFEIEEETLDVTQIVKVESVIGSELPEALSKPVVASKGTCKLVDGTSK